VDAVEKYRKYDAEGNAVKGDYARVFEEEYRRLANHPTTAPCSRKWISHAQPKRFTTATSP